MDKRILGVRATDQRKWNELQNTSRDIQMLTNYLLSEYKARVWGKRSLPDH